MLRSVQAENVLTGILQTQPEITMNSLALVDRKQNRLSDTLSIVTLHNDEQFVSTCIAVKQETEPEPQEMVVIKSEVEYEEHVVAGSPQLPEDFEEEFREETTTVNDCKAESQADPASMLEVEINVVQDASSQFSSEQHLASTPKIFKRSNETTYSNQQDLLITNTQTGGKPFECTYCQRKFKWKQCLERHVTTHTGEKPFRCDVCQRQFSQPHHLRDHLRTHTGERIHKCNICNISFRILSSLKRHFSRVHIGEKLYECSVCKIQFEYQKDYNEHIKSHNSEPKVVHECELCHRRFEKKYHLQRHAKVHTGEKPHECTVCGRRFSEKRNMLTHVKTHYVGKT